MYLIFYITIYSYVNYTLIKISSYVHFTTEYTICVDDKPQALLLDVIKHLSII